MTASLRPRRLRRSELSTPGTSTKMIAKAAASAADLVFLDLEDAVAPAQKAGARKNIVDGLNDLDWGGKVRSYRINGVHTSWCHDDLIEVVSGAGSNIDVIIIPKVKAPRDVWFVDDLVSQLERKLGLEVGGIGLEVLVEEVEALACVEEICRSSERLEAVILGVGDLSASQGMRLRHLGVTDGEGPIQYPGDLWHFARNRMIVAARAAGMDAIDGPYANFANGKGYERSAAWFSIMGGVGKWCIHPSQVDIANRVFAPTPEEIAEASDVVAAVREAEARGEGAANLNGMMIDAATTRVFEVTLARAQQCGLL
ncbi:MAG: CoA ester lyase [Acidimicrobiales bacterium]|nr:CoA ester lyase [Acidimicrobiales bacterium]